MIVVVCAAVGLFFVVPTWNRWKLEHSPRQGCIDQAVVLDIAAAALASGLAIPAMLIALHSAVDDPSIRIPSGAKHRPLNEVANMLMMGASWEDAWDGVSPLYVRLGESLEPAWNAGIAPLALLQRAAQGLRLSRARRAKQAAARLGSTLVVPLATCFLPAFILIGVVPVVVATAGSLF